MLEKVKTSFEIRQEVLPPERFLFWMQLAGSIPVIRFPLKTLT